MLRRLAVSLLSAGVVLSGPAIRASAQTADTEQPTVLDDVLVEGRSIRPEVRRFVGSVAAPAPDRAPARWEGSLCVGVLNLQADVAHAMADRVSDIAADLGLEIGAPGCKPNLVIMATGDGAALAQELVRTRRPQFLLRTAGASAGERGLQDFQTSPAPVRWWNVSLPINEDTGQPAVRVEGQSPFMGITNGGRNPSDYGPLATVTMGSRLSTSVSDQLQQVLVILDINKAAGADFTQLSDYVAMVGLAQIDPKADTSGFDTILNLFDPGASPPAALTPFDLAYLHGLYDAQGRSRFVRARTAAVAAEMERALRRTRAPVGATADPGNEGAAPKIIRP